MAFIDELNLKISAGKGGDGVVRWRHEKFRPLAGPGGGNGGRGGDVYVKAVLDNSILSANYRVKKEFKAKDGKNGQSTGKDGKDGDDLVLTFPVGTVLVNTETNEKIELLENEQMILLLKGGVGGFGNEHFKGSKNQAPTQSTAGKSGQSGEFFVELQMIADIGLVGLPNAGKSTLLNALSNANAKIGDYPFTTIEPNLGMLDGLIIADIPGLIEGASDGKGLGDKFLKHIMRTKTIAHVISAENQNVKESYSVIKKELTNYDKQLVDKKQIIILSKADQFDEETINTKKEELEDFTGNEVVIFSAFDENLILQLKDKLIKIARN